MNKNHLLLIKLAALFFSLITITSTSANQDIISSLVKDAPILDGSGTDTAWQAAKIYTIRDKRRDVDILFKSVHTEDMIFFYVQYPDEREDTLQKPWVWNKDMEIYTIGPQREDTFMFRWNMENH